jgi:hypothetical protein
MTHLHERFLLPEFLNNNEPQIKAPRVTPLEGVYTHCSAIRGRGVGIEERRFDNRVSSIVHALKSVFAPSACFAVRLKYAPQRARRTPVTRSYIMYCRVLPLPFGVILLRCASAATLRCKALRTIWRNLKD